MKMSWAQGHATLCFPVCLWSFANSSPILLSYKSVGTTCAQELSEGGISLKALNIYEFACPLCTVHILTLLFTAVLASGFCACQV